MHWVLPPWIVGSNQQASRRAQLYGYLHFCGLLSYVSGSFESQHAIEILSYDLLSFYHFDIQ